VSPLLALSEGAIFAIGSVIFIAVFTAALGLAYARFAELGDDDRAAEVPTGVRPARRGR
jgi:hypothetical protein